MTVLLQMSFKFPKEQLGENLAIAAKPLAESITKEPGFIAKIWTENEKEGEAGGIYLFENREFAETYLGMHQTRMSKTDACDIEAKIFEVNDALTKITSGPLTFFK